MHLTQIRLIVSDFTGTAAFYRDVIGLRPQFDTVAPPYVAFKPEHGSALSLHDRADLDATLGGVLRGGPGADGALIALRVDDLDRYLTEVTGRGAEILTGPVAFGDRIRSAYLRDPEGNLLEIQQWLATRTGDPVPPAN
ncbi:VOC family protein [Nocardia sp. BMG111209]|uniref:VOC family protein n=1 Tax=Nocardia sp. BMG111209 TaxID=1160137 RepID=UPI000361B22E|nr:VOC family protein [Nocardia sp. BMG111209]